MDAGRALEVLEVGAQRNAVTVGLREFALRAANAFQPCKGFGKKPDLSSMQERAQSRIKG